MELIFHHPEFEQEVRERLNIFDRAVTEADAVSIHELELSNFDFKDEDIETLLLFTDLIFLDINIRRQDLFFWDHFTKLRYLYWECWGDEIDFAVFSNMRELRSLTVSGGAAHSNIKFKGLDSLIPLNRLEELTLHEFGSVDLAPLENMPWLKHFSLQYADSCQNIETIGKLRRLESLILRGLCIDDPGFLDLLPDHTELEMCGIEFSGKYPVDVLKWKRFKDRDISEITVNGRNCISV
ncbi:MAG: hypothetical protein IJO94_05870 [Firmicutes bacterium]|nr:hypothetical protein [Bacillota bacterium]